MPLYFRAQGSRSLTARLSRYAIAFCVASVFALALASGAFAAKTKLTLATYGEVSERLVYKEIEKAFEKAHSDIDLEVVIIPWGEYITKITTLFAGGNAPDVFLTWAQYKPKWVDSGMLLDLTPYIQKSKLARVDLYYPVIKDVITYKGKYWGTPSDFNAMVWMVNTDLLDESGLAVPKNNWTTEDLRRISQKVTRPSDKIFGTTNIVSWGSLDNLQWTYNFSGHYWVDEDEKEVLINDPKVASMLDFWYKMMYEWKVTPSNQNPLPGNLSFFTGNLAMSEGWIAYMIRLEEVRQKAEAKGGTMWDWTFVPFPAGPAAQKNFAQGHLWSIPSTHKNPALAWKLAEWLGSLEAESIFTGTGRSAPQVGSDRLWDYFLRRLPSAKAKKLKEFFLYELYSGKSYAKNFNYWNTYGEMQDQVMAPALNSIFNLQKPIGPTLQSAEKQMQTILDNYNKRRKK